MGVTVSPGQASWEAAVWRLLGWGAKTRSGFDVVPDTGAGTQVEPGGDSWLVASIGPWRVGVPLLLVAQRWYRRRYLRALRQPAGEPG